jgi:hypothetical protein
MQVPVTVMMMSQQLSDNMRAIKMKPDWGYF